MALSGSESEATPLLFSLHLKRESAITTFRLLYQTPAARERKSVRARGRGRGGRRRLASSFCLFFFFFFRLCNRSVSEGMSRHWNVTWDAEGNKKNKKNEALRKLGNGEFTENTRRKKNYATSVSPLSSFFPRCIKQQHDHNRLFSKQAVLFFFLVLFLMLAPVG